ncbi:MAG: hypothetical protein Q7R45_00635 [Sulfuricaulis sp.]|nr:hypothetical protein [Sulfuricaulis sp.]
MQKRIQCAVLGRIVTVEIALRIIEQRVAFRVQQNYLQRDRLQTAQRLAGAIFVPTVEKNWRAWSRDGENIGGW